MTGRAGDGRHLRVRELLRAPGVQRRATGSLTVEPGELTSARLDVDRQVDYDLVLEARGGRVHVQGTVTGDWQGPCRRCLAPTTGVVETRIDEIFEAHPTPGETWPISEGDIDLEPVLREALLLELPLAPLCGEDCAGPDPDRYPAATPADAPDSATPPPRDPRWAALDDLTFDDPGDTRP